MVHIREPLNRDSACCVLSFLLTQQWFSACGSGTLRCHWTASKEVDFHLRKHFRYPQTQKYRKTTALGRLCKALVLKYFKYFS